MDRPSENPDLVSSIESYEKLKCTCGRQNLSDDIHFLQNKVKFIICTNMMGEIMWLGKAGMNFLSFTKQIV